MSLHELTPSLEQYLAQAAYLQLSAFERLSRALVDAPDTAAKVAISRVAHRVLGRHHALVAALETEGHDASVSMEPFEAPTKEFQARTQGGDWAEQAMAAYVVSGMIDDTFASIAEGLPGDFPQRMRELFAGDETSDALAAVLTAAIDADPQRASRLALWGRRLVGDTLLVARSACAIPQDTATDDERLEPVFTELIADHTRRMDDLGLTA